MPEVDTMMFFYWPVSMPWFAPVSFLVSKHVLAMVHCHTISGHHNICWDHVITLLALMRSKLWLYRTCSQRLSLSLIISLIIFIRLEGDKTQSSSLLWVVQPEMENVKEFLRWFNLINLLFGIGHVRCGLRQIIIWALKCPPGHLVTPE